MVRKRPFQLIVVLFVLGLVLVTGALVMAADSDPAVPVTAKQEPPGPDGAAVVDYILNTDPYTEWGTWEADRWTDFSGYIHGASPHGNTVRIFANDVARDAVASEGFDGVLPAGSIVVKENYGGTVDAPGDLAALTLQIKIDGYNPAGGDWFFVKTAADGSVDAAGAIEGCLNCHSQEGNADYLLRYAFGEQPAVSYGEPLPEADGAALVDYILNTNPYTAWGSFPTDEVKTDDFSGFLASGAPHGNTVRIFANDRALNALTSGHFHERYPNGSIIVKENYGGTVDAPGDLAALTIMYKVAGFNPDANDWFFVKTAADGTVDAAGAIEGCIGCHSQEGNSDYLLRFDSSGYVADMMMGDEMATALDGNALIDQRCTTCHTRDRIDSKTKDRAGWTETVDRMIGYGATLSDEERAAMLDYLAGDEMMMGPDGNELIDLRCTTCHSRERIDSKTKDRAGWTETVDRMVGYGARLDDVEREAVIAYLAGE